MRGILLIISFILLCNGIVLAGNNNHNITKSFPEIGVDINAIVQDSSGIFWIGTEYGLKKFDGKNIVTYRHDWDKKGSISDNDITCLYIDKKETLWIGTRWGGLNKFIPHKNEFVNYFNSPKHDTVFSSNSISKIFEDSKNNFWVGTYGGGICKLDRETGESERYIHNPEDKNSLSDNYIFSIIELKNGKICVGTNGKRFNIFNERTNTFDKVISGVPYGYGLYAYHLKDDIYFAFSQGGGISVINFDTQKYFKIKYSDDNYNLNDARVHCVIHYTGDEYIIGTELSGLFIFNFKTKECKRANITFQNNDKDLNDIGSLYKDKWGNIWLTSKKGLYVINKYDNLFNTININLPKGVKITELIKLSDKEYFVGTNNGIYSIKSGEVKFLCLSGVYINQIVRTSNNQYWISSINNNGIYVYDINMRKELNHIKYVEGKDYGLLGNDIFTLFEDSDGNKWASSQSGLCLIKKDNSIKRIEHDYVNLNKDKISYHKVTGMLEDDKRNLWMATERGITKLNLDTYKTEHYHNEIEKTNRWNISKYNMFTSISIQGDSIVWLGSIQGLVKYNIHKNQFNTLTEKDGLSNSSVMSVLVDKNENVWVGTIDGISVLNTRTGKFKNYQKNNGLRGENYFKSAVFNDSTFVFMGESHIVSSVFDSFSPENGDSEICFTDIIVNNQSIYTEENNRYKDHISSNKNISLPYNNRSFTVNFSSMNGTFPSFSNYAYKLEGLDKNWNNVGERNFAVYTNVPYGSYKLLVKSTNNYGEWSSKAEYLNISVEYPWWLKPYFIILVMVIICVVAFIIYVNIRKQNILKANLKVQQVINEKMKIINKNKISFYTNLTHEFRTPLTLILGPLEKMLVDIGNVTKDKLNIVKRNADRLLNLSNQLLDIRKVDNNQFRLSLEEVEINREINNLTSSYALQADNMDVNFSIKLSSNTEKIYVDLEFLSKILNNLLSNAFKFVNRGGNISVDSSCLRMDDKEYISISVTDDGIGIPEEDLSNIFNQFFVGKSKAGTGTGLGLALLKHLIGIHKGWVEVDSVLGEHTKFTVYFPKDSSVYEKSDFKPSKTYSKEYRNETVLTGEKTLEINSNKDLSLTVLIVEDDKDMLDYLSDNISEYYNVIKACNGNKALKILKNTNVDLILTDVMMPETDGFELSRRVNETQALKHIPIIMLTALNEEHNLQKSLELGVDAFISKPFSIDILVLKISNILNSRETFKTKIFGSIEVDSSNLAFSEKEFLAKIVDILKENYTDCDFGVAELVANLYLSHSLVYKKVKQITGKTIQEFINSYRLKQARDILQKEKLPIKEVAYKVGFSDPKYFSVSFKKKYKVSPSAVFNSIKR